MARTAAGSRSGMDEYELHGHLNEKLFRAIGNCFENLSSSVGSISEEIYSRQAVYLSYTVTYLLDNGEDLATAADMAGHASADTTRRYLRHQKRRNRAAADKIDF
jgi:hypothetical protein